MIKPVSHIKFSSGIIWTTFTLHIFNKNMIKLYFIICPIPWTFSGTIPNLISYWLLKIRCTCGVIIIRTNNLVIKSSRLILCIYNIPDFCHMGSLLLSTEKLKDQNITKYENLYLFCCNKESRATSVPVRPTPALQCTSIGPR
uniref:Uncharacterized protein n=1 Tax=Glossina brevipalpis TaxID=37001 RepID=A0A1A9W4L7_9MUSC